MSAQVDVLAVMDLAAASFDAPARADAMRKARAAVAALIAERDALRDKVEQQAVILEQLRKDFETLRGLDRSLESLERSITTGESA